MSAIKGYTLADMELLRELMWTTQGWQEVTRQGLIDKGYSEAAVDRIALPYEHNRYVMRYREIFVSGAEREPELSPRDHLIACGYPPEAVDAFLVEYEANLAESERRRAERDSYESTWRYRTRQAYRDAHARIRTAWDVLRGRHECEEL